MYRARTYSFHPQDSQSPESDSTWRGAIYLLKDLNWAIMHVYKCQSDWRSAYSI